MILAAAVAGCFALTGSEALASPVGCGDTITKDTKLHNDLTNCPNNGILIGADDITLDLNGHTIDGDGKRTENCPPQTPCDVGVFNEGHNGVRIKGGSIREFELGVSVLGASDNRLRHLSSSDNAFGGLVVFQSTHSRVERNSANHNGSPTEHRGTGIVLIASHNIRTERNSVSGNGDDGIFVSGSNNNRIAKNSVSGNSFSGIGIEGDGNEVSDNTVHRNDDNVIVFGNRNRVTGNEISHAVGCGQEGCGYGISVEGGEGNLVANNWVASALNDTIRVASFDPHNPTVGTVVRDNLARAAGVDGISVGTDGEKTDVTHTLIQGNRASAAGDDGLDVESAATKLTRNTANRNHDLGIEAVHGVTDGGGNKASGNGNPAQCTNVVCS
jgi:parallel beta-helix repeat protein